MCPDVHLHSVEKLTTMLCRFSLSQGSSSTPGHHHGDFRFKTYAPIAFRYFREMFGIRPDDYLVISSLL